MIEENDTVRLQPCFSPVWDTALTLNALADAAVTRTIIARSIGGAAGCWPRKCGSEGDWSLTNPQTGAGRLVLRVSQRLLSRHRRYGDGADGAWPRPGRRNDRRSADRPRSAVYAGLLGMQNNDGGWAAFDRDINREMLTKVPFADHNAMLDPSCPDITARVLEALGQYGYRRRASAGCTRHRIPAEDAGRTRLLDRPLGRQLHLRHLASAVRTAQHRLRHERCRWCGAPSAGSSKVQQPGGGWGETCRSYDDPSLAGQGKPTASQTAWALLALVAAGESDSDAVRGGIEYCSKRRARTATGTKSRSPAPAFLKSST